MTDPTPSDLPPDKRPAQRGTVRAYWRLAGGYWRGRTARQAWILTIITFALVIVNIGVQVFINRWNATFFDALDKRQATQVLGAVGLIVVLALSTAAIAVFQLLSRMRLQVYWRQWLTSRLTERWLGDQRFYRLTIAAPDLDSPEFRIADDARIATEPIVDFGVGISNAVLTALVFFGVLWIVGGSITVGGVTIPGFMVLGAAVYSGLMTGSMVLFGRPLIAKIEQKNAAEAALRAEMVRVRENAESIALIGGEADETRGLRLKFQVLVAAWLRQINQLGRMTMADGHELGDGAGGAAAAVRAQVPGWGNEPGAPDAGRRRVRAGAGGAETGCSTNYPRIAEWLASAGRVTALWGAFTALDKTVGETEEDHIVIADSPDDKLYLSGLQVAQYNGRVMIDEADAVIAMGDKVLLTGDSGTGKSTLIRAVAGLWPLGLRPRAYPPRHEDGIPAAEGLHSARHAAPGPGLPRPDRRRAGRGAAQCTGTHRPAPPDSPPGPGGPLGQGALGRGTAAHRLRPPAGPSPRYRGDGPKPPRRWT